MSDVARYEREPDWSQPLAPVEETGEPCSHCYTPSDAPRDGEAPPLVRKFLRRYEVADGYRCGKCAKAGQPRMPPPCRCRNNRTGKPFAACTDGVHMVEVIGWAGDVQLRAVSSRSPVTGRAELERCEMQEPFYREKRLRFMANRNAMTKPEGM